VVSGAEAADDDARANADATCGRMRGGVDPLNPEERPTETASVDLDLQRHAAERRLDRLRGPPPGDQPAATPPSAVPGGPPGAAGRQPVTPTAVIRAWRSGLIGGRDRVVGVKGRECRLRYRQAVLRGHLRFDGAPVERQDHCPGRPDAGLLMLEDAVEPH